jgi:hypothetical protein
MSSLKALRPTPAMFVALIALVMAMSGAAVALPGKNSVDSTDLAKGSVTTRAIEKGAVGSKQIDGKSIKGNRLKDGAVKADQLADGAVTDAKLADNAVIAAKIADGAVTAAKVGDGTLSTKNLSDDFVISSDAGSFVKLTATEGATAVAARAAAPETTLFTKGDITISAKCLQVTAGNTIAEMYIATATNGAVFNGSSDDLQGGPAATDFLNTDTDDVDRTIDDATAPANDAAYNEGELTALAPDGTSLIGQTSVGAKNGTLAGGNGVYGEGNVCVFGGEFAG